MTGVQTCALPISRLPEGVYHHDVGVFMEGKDPQRFVGLMTLKGGRIGIVMLSPFGTTLARLSDALDQDDLHIDIYTDELKPYQQRLADFFLALKPALVDPTTTEVKAYGHALLVDHLGILNGVPKLTTISRDGVRITIEVTSFEKA